MSISVHIIFMGALLILASYQDIKTGKIKNQLNGSFALLGVALFLFEHGFSDETWVYLKEIGLIFMLCLLFFFLRFISGGDGKLFIAISTLMGFRFTIGVFTYSIILGAIVEIGLYILKKKDRKVHKKIKFAPFILLSAIFEIVYPLLSLLNL